MISLDQIRLLEQKVEGAVAKIMQLSNENIALKKQHALLEEENQNLRGQLSLAEQDQQLIEQGIIKALDKLNIVENSVLLAASAQIHQEVQNSDNLQPQADAPVSMNNQTDETTVESDSVMSDIAEATESVESLSQDNNLFSMPIDGEETSQNQLDIF